MNKFFACKPAIAILLAVLGSCEYDYNLALSSWTGDGIYIAERTRNTVTGKISDLDTTITKQLLVYGTDTTKIIKNGIVTEILIGDKFKNWVGRRKNGKTIFTALTPNGRKDFMIEIENIKIMGPGKITVGTVMNAPYDKNLDTLKTEYWPYN
jgi:hypothetical protein